MEVWRELSAQANGNTRDRQGRLVTCEHETRRVTRTELNGTVLPVVTHFKGKRLNSPNDVVCKSDGSIYFSDPPYAVKPEDRELDFQGVYRVVASAVPQPTGLNSIRWGKRTPHRPPASSRSGGVGLAQ